MSSLFANIARPDWARGIVTAALLVAALWLLSACSQRTNSSHGTAAGFEPLWDKLVVEVAAFEEQQPSGIAVNSEGRVFVSFPWWGSQPSPAVAEIAEDGTLQPYPSKYWNDWDGKGGPSALRGFVCAQAMYVDHDDFLWVLDTGNPRNRTGVVIAGPKLFKINTLDNSIAQVFYFDHKRDFTRSSYLSDFRVDSDRQVAYITDSARGTIYVVDLKTRQTHHVLLGDPSTTADAAVIARVGSQEWRTYMGWAPQVNVSGVELSADGDWLYYHTMSGRRIYRVPTNVLRDERISDATRSAAIEDLGTTGSVIDGMWLDEEENLYLAAIEKDAIYVRRPTGSIETFVADPRLKWPDSMAMGPDGYLYFTTSMRHLHKPYRLVSQIEDPHYVMKASPEKVARANVTRKLADERHAEASHYAGEASKAEKFAKIAEAKAKKELLKAKAVLEAAEAAKLAAQKRSEAHTLSVSKIDEAADKQTQAAKQATKLSKMADQQAIDAKKAADEAKKAAEIARRLADAATKKAEQMRALQAKAKLSAEEAEQAKRLHKAAIAQAAAAQKAAEQAEANAASMDADAKEALRLAKEARDLAERERVAAENLRELANQARQAAAFAERLATEAEFAEINPPKADGIETVEVPTTTD